MLVVALPRGPMDFSAKLDPPGRWGEVDAADAIEFAAWTVDHPRLAVPDAIDARDYADVLAQQGRRQ
jgi:hypothetical protein